MNFRATTPEGDGLQQAAASVSRKVEAYHRFRELLEAIRDEPATPPWLVILVRTALEAES